MRRFLAPTLAALALLIAVPVHAQSVEQQFSRLNADRAYRLGVQQYRIHNYQAAQRQFEKATALAPDVPNYRRSLLLTKQRLAIVKANRKALQDSLNRTRQGFVTDPDDPDARESDSAAPPDGLRTDPSSRGPAAGAPAASRAPTASSTPTRPAAGDPTATAPTASKAAGSAVSAPRIGRGAKLGASPTSNEEDLRDATRDLDLGGGVNPMGIPNDLPIAGTPGGDLPIGRLPPDELQPQLPTKSRALAMPSDDANAAPLPDEPSMFPFLDPPKEPPPDAMARPRLDTPKGPR